MKRYKLYITLFLLMIISVLFTGCATPKKEIVFRLDENDVELGVGET